MALANVDLMRNELFDLLLYFGVNSVARLSGEVRLGSHVDLLSRLRTTDPEQAEAAVREHLRVARTALIRRFTTKPI